MMGALSIGRGLPRTVGALLLTAFCCTGCGAAADASGADRYDVPLTCANYCNIMLRHCRNTWQMYPSIGACMDACSPWPVRTASGPAHGNSLECRLLYGDLAMKGGNLASNCLNAGPQGGQMCHD